MDSEQSIQYFERTLGGLFKLKEFKDPPDGERPRFVLELTPKLQEDGRILLSKFAISLRTVEKREPIKGVSLQVGKPILATRRYTADLRVRDGKGYGFIVGPGDGQGVLIIWLTVTVYEKEVKLEKQPEARKESEAASMKKPLDEKERNTHKGEATC